METWNERTNMLIGECGANLLSTKKVAVFGVGGVGGFVCEALARAGIGEIDLFDDDIVSLSNINRQIIALHSTLGMPKVDIMKKRILDINPSCKVKAHRVFYLAESAKDYPLDSYSYIVDAIDTVSAKLVLVEQAKASNVPIICSMGAGNKMQPSLFRVANIEETSVCPLARVMRQELKKRRIKKVKAVYSTENPIKPISDPNARLQSTSAHRKGASKQNSLGSISFVPAAAGLLLAGEVIRDLLA